MNNYYTLNDLISDEELYHHGIKGQKWGVRRFQNKDGSLTSAGKKRYDDDGPNNTKTDDKSDNRKQHGKAYRTGEVVVKTFLMNTVSDMVAANLIVRGQEQVGKMLKTGADLYSWYYLGKGLYDIHGKKK